MSPLMFIAIGLFFFLALVAITVLLTIRLGQGKKMKDKIQ